MTTRPMTIAASLVVLVVASAQTPFATGSKGGGGGVKAAVRGYRVAVKTGTAKKIGPNGQYIDKYVAYTAGVAPASQPRFALVVVINNPQGGKYYGGAVSAPVFSDIMGQILRTMNVEPDAIPTGIVGHS
mgnify:CR=1 FL=1